MTEANGWEAWIDLMPGKEPALHVSGVFEAPTRGWSAELVEHNPHGINQKELLLDLVTHEPTGQVSKVLTPVPVSFEKAAARGEYETVSILPDGPSSIPVKETS